MKVTVGRQARAPVRLDVEHTVLANSTAAARCCMCGVRCCLRRKCVRGSVCPPCCWPWLSPVPAELAAQVHESWLRVLAPEFRQTYWRRLQTFVDEERRTCVSRATGALASALRVPGCCVCVCACVSGAPLWCA